MRSLYYKDNMLNEMNNLKCFIVPFASNATYYFLFKISTSKRKYL